MNKEYYIGIDIGGTKCAILAGTVDMEILDKIQFATETHKGPDYAINNLINNTDLLINKYGKHNLKAIGISCGGPLDSKRGIILSPPNLPGWDNITITKLFSEKFNVPVHLQNDANASALAEWQFGAGKGTENMIFITFGTGLGAGLVLNGKLYTGTNDLAGEIWNIRLAEDGLEPNGKKGSFEGFCSGSGIARFGQKIISDKLKKGIDVPFCSNLEKVNEIDTKQLAEAAINGDQTAIEIFNISAEYLGKGLSILIDILNPEKIIIGSVYARNPQLFKSACQKVLKEEALEPARKVCQIVPAALGDKVGDYASLSVAMIATEFWKVNENL